MRSIRNLAKSAWPIAIVTAIALGITACGGGGGSDSSGAGGSATTPTAPTTPPTTPTTPPVAPAIAPTLSLNVQSIKNFRLTWADIADETEYRLLENPDGSSGYTQVATIAANATGHDHVIFLPGRINARYILQACNGGACVDSAPVHVTGSLATAIGYVKASNTREHDNFGTSVAMAADGNTLAVGAPLEDGGTQGINGNQTDSSAGNSGAVYVFIRSGSQWVQQAYVKASNTETHDEFGRSVALSADGNTLAVGATGESSSSAGINGDQANNDTGSSGAVYVFTRSGSNWSQQAYVKASNPGYVDKFGSSVALSADGNTLAVGATEEDSGSAGINANQADESVSASGAVYVFIRSATLWSQEAYLKSSNPGLLDRFGTSISLSANGDTLAVGAPNESSNARGINGDQTNNLAGESGAAYVFTRSSGTWTQQAYVKASNTGATDYFGQNIALSADGKTLAAGAFSEDSNATGINGDDADNSALRSGAVYVFTYDGALWSQQAYVKASNTEAQDTFGSTVALSGNGNVLAVGAPGESGSSTGIGGNQADNGASGSGAIYVFSRNDSSWTQKAYVKAPNTAAEDLFGTGLALSVDGSTMAVGATREDSIAGGVGGNQTSDAASNSGAVYLY